MWAFAIFFLVLYLASTEWNSTTSSSAEVLVFRRGHVPSSIANQTGQNDEEGGTSAKTPPGSCES